MARELRVQIIGDSKSLEAAMGRSSAAVEGFGSKMQKVGGKMESIGKTMTTHLTLPLVGIGAIMVKTALDAETSTARMDTAFKNVGVSVQGASKQVDAMEASGRRLGFMNSQVRDSLGSLVTSTGSLSKAQRELSIAEDLARFKGVDLSLATRALTMANAGSMRAIKQLGITIIPVTNAVDALKNSHMKLNTEQGRAALAAAKLIDKQATVKEMLDIVQGKVKGQGAAFAATAAGGMQVFRAQLDQLSEKMGATLLPILNRLMDALGKALDWFNSLSPSTQKWIEIIAGAAAAVGPVVGIVGALTSALGGLATAAMFLAANPLVLLVAAVAAVGGAMAAAVLAPQQFEAVLQRFGVSAQDAARVVRDLQQAFQDIRMVVAAVWPLIKAEVVGSLNIIIAAVKLFSDVLHGNWSKLWGDLKALLVAPLNAIVGVARAQFNLLVSIIGGTVASAAAKAKALGQAIVDGVISVVHTIGGKVKGALDAIWGVISRVASLAFNAATAIGAEIIHGIISGVEGAIGGAIHTIESAASSLWGAMKSAVGAKSPATKFIPIGKSIMDGVGVGIQGAVGGVVTAITTAVTSIIQAAVIAARAQLATAKTNLNSAMGNLGSSVLSAAGALGPAFGTKSTRALGSKLTSEQQAQADQQAKAQQAALDKATLDARTKLSADIAAGADHATLAADQAAIDTAVQANADYQAQKQIDADAKALAEQQKRDRDNLEKQWSALQNELKAHPERAAKIKKEIDALLKKFGITPASVTASQDWNAAQTLFVQGMGDLKTSMDALTAAILNLAGAKAAAVSPGGGGLPHLASGGPVPIIAHAGEYVVRADAVKKLGGPVLNYMNQTGNLPRFADGGIIKLPPIGPNPKINPTTGGPDDPAYRAAAMYLNDYGNDRNVTSVGTALAGLLGPRAQAQAAIRHTFVDGEELRKGSWRAPAIDEKVVARLQTQYPVIFEAGTPGQQISAAQAISRLKGGMSEVESLIAGSVGVSGKNSKLERLTSHAVHIAQGYAYLTHAQNAAAAVGYGRNNPSFIPAMATGGRLLSDGLFYGHKGERVTPAKVSHGGSQPITHVTILKLNEREIGRSVQTFLGEQARWGGNGIPR